MGFGKQASEKGKKAFEPTTDQELKDIRKRARQKDDAKNDKKLEKNSEPRKPRNKRDELRYLFESNSDMKIFRRNLFERFVEFCKDNDLKPPGFETYKPRKEAEAGLIYEIQFRLARMSWVQLSKLISTAVNYPLPTRDFTEAFHFTQHAMYLALGVKEKNGVYGLTDPDILDEWPVEDKKRPSKEDRMSKQKALEMKARARDENEEEETEDEEEEKGTEEEEEIDEDTKPRKKFGGGKEKAKKSKPVKEKREKPVKEKVKAKKSSGDDGKYRIAKKFKGGVREQAQSVILTNGSTFDQIVAACKKKFDFNEGKVKGYVSWLSANGFIKKV